MGYGGAIAIGLVRTCFPLKDLLPIIDIWCDKWGNQHLKPGQRVNRGRVGHDKHAGAFSLFGRRKWKKTVIVPKNIS